MHSLCVCECGVCVCVCVCVCARAESHSSYSIGQNLESELQETTCSKEREARSIA